jgi:hypothetical protein
MRLIPTALGLNKLRFAVYEGLALEMETAMLRIVSTLLLSGGIAFGGMSAASAQPERAKSNPTVPARVAATPLAAGPAAGIRQAQGSQRDRVWRYVPFAVVGGLALLVVLATGNDDNDSTSTTTGTN